MKFVFCLSNSAAKNILKVLKILKKGFSSRACYSYVPSNVNYCSVCIVLWRDTEWLYYATTCYQKPWDFRISITTDPIRFWMVLMDSLGLIYIRKVSSFCSHGPYELRYFDVKWQFAEFHVHKIKNVIVIVIVLHF